MLAGRYAPVARTLMCLVLPCMTYVSNCWKLVSGCWLTFGASSGLVGSFDCGDNATPLCACVAPNSPPRNTVRHADGLTLPLEGGGVPASDLCIDMKGQ